MINCRTEKIKEIKEIKEKNYKHKYVYDFSVKDNETFSLKNGLIAHNTLNSFHYSGVASKSNVNSGVPRLSEIIRVTSTPKTPSMTVYLDQSIKTDKKKVINFLNKIKNTFLNEFIEQSSIYYDNQFKNKSSSITKYKSFIENYLNFYSLFNDTKFLENLENWVLEFNISPIILYNKNIKIYELINILNEYFSNKKLKTFIINNEENPKNIFIQIRFFKEQEITYNKLLEFEQDIINNLIFNGIPNIDMAYIREISINTINKKTDGIEKKKEFIIDTNGSDLYELFEYDEVDTNKSITNDINEVNKVFGIEMAREITKQEILGVMSHSGIRINKTHVNLVVDKMTHRGIFRSLDRHGISKTDSGPIFKASFEETDTHFQQASLYSQKDAMKSFSSTVIFTQRGKYGTGFCDIIYED
jgi:DNA-directed RNA polymerase II subunit RPB1